jgi:hypothetical protein
MAKAAQLKLKSRRAGADLGSSLMEFQAYHHVAHRLAGTVPLPSPFPATGSVSVVIVPDGEEFEIFVKVLHIVSDRRTITRFLRPEDIRAIRARPSTPAPGDPESWPVLGFKKIKGELDERTKALLASAKAGVSAEASWYPSAIVYVPESAPVLHRSEAGLTAAVSAEDVWAEGRVICC